jgi:hypothetical protein
MPPNCPLPSPACGRFHGMLEAFDGGGTALRSSSRFTQEIMGKKAPKTRSSMRYFIRKKLATSLNIANEKYFAR